MKSAWIGSFNLKLKMVEVKVPEGRLRPCLFNSMSNGISNGIAKDKSIGIVNGKANSMEYSQY